MSTAPAGWHPDPTNPDRALRYWNGSAWTEHTHPRFPAAAPVATPPVAQPGSAAPVWANVAPAAPTAPAAPQAAYAPHSPYAAYGSGFAAPDQRTFVHKNVFSLVTVGAVLLYVVLAFTVHIVLLGILPVIMSIRAFKAKEPLAPAAAVAAGLAVVFALLALA